jgi:hypothetical protein
MKLPLFLSSGTKSWSIISSKSALVFGCIIAFLVFGFVAHAKQTFKDKKIGKGDPAAPGDLILADISCNKPCYSPGEGNLLIVESKDEETASGHPSSTGELPIKVFGMRKGGSRKVTAPDIVRTKQINTYEIELKEIYPKVLSSGKTSDDCTTFKLFSATAVKEKHRVWGTSIFSYLYSAGDQLIFTNFVKPLKVDSLKRNKEFRKWWDDDINVLEALIKLREKPEKLSESTVMYSPGFGETPEEVAFVQGLERVRKRLQALGMPVYVIPACSEMGGGH